MIKMIKTSVLVLPFVFALVAIVPAPAEASWWFNTNTGSARCTGEVSGSGPSSCDVTSWDGRRAVAYEVGGLCLAEVTCLDESVISCYASETWLTPWGEEPPICYASAQGGNVLCKSDIGLYSDYCQD